MLKKILTLICALIILGGTSAATMIHAEDETYTNVIAESVSNPYSGGWANCTWSAWQLVYQATGYAFPRLGNAGAWYGAAAAMGYEVSTTPRANSIAVWGNHVAYVTAVDFENDQIYIQEGNFNGAYNEGWIPSWGGRYSGNIIGFVYVPTDGFTPAVITYTAPTVEKKEVEFSLPEVVEENVIRVDDAVSIEPIKKVDEMAIDELKKEDQERLNTQTNKVLVK